MTEKTRVKSFPRVVIAAPKSGSGKTTITCALLRALTSRGMKLCSYKCGPDYIDPMFHRSVLGIDSGNLDLFFTDESQTKTLFAKEYVGEMAVIEGVMGLYDGLGGISCSASTYHLASILKAPIILVLDAHGAGRSLLAELRGFLDYDTDHLIKGVILNRTSQMFGEELSPVIEKELGIPVLGTMPNDKSQLTSSRHLGLVMPEEIPDLQRQLDESAAVLAKNVDIEKILQIANGAAELGLEELEIKELEIADAEREEKGSQSTYRIAVAKDEAFCFYYRENLEMLRECGAELIFFSPIHDEKLPEGIDGLILGGGYPELHLQALSSNESMKNEIKEKIRAGLPVMAECGGFMYLGKTVTDEHGDCYEMVGIYDGESKWTGKLVRFGYAEFTDLRTGEKVRGHEFHYYDSTDNGEAFEAKKPTGKRSWHCMHKAGNVLMGFPHLYYPSNGKWLAGFFEKMDNYKRQQ